MTQPQLAELVRSRLEGDDRICDIIHETLGEIMDELGIDIYSEDGYELATDVLGSISFAITD